MLAASLWKRLGKLFFKKLGWRRTWSKKVLVKDGGKMYNRQ